MVGERLVSSESSPWSNLSIDFPIFPAVSSTIVQEALVGVGNHVGRERQQLGFAIVNLGSGFPDDSTGSNTGGRRRRRTRRLSQMHIQQQLEESLCDATRLPPSVPCSVACHDD
jgi:hypothetical protein